MVAESKTPWTKGPWRTSKVAGNTVLLNEHAGNISYLDMAPDSANARLISKAPELFTELEVRASDLHMLRKAIESGDPKGELLVRVDDMLRETKALLQQIRGDK